MRGLDNLCWNLQVQADILKLGKRAVGALVGFLHEPPSQFPDGRVLAAEVLGRIGCEAAFQGLLKALDSRRLENPNPVLRLSEETVQDAVARQLGRIGDRRADLMLIEALHRNRLLGAAEALLQFREPRALPWLVEGLEDAFKRTWFAHIIMEFGRAAVPHLAETLHHRRMYGDEELLPSLERRAEALKLLGLLGATEVTGDIRSALTDPSDVVRVEAALALAVVEEGDEVLDAVPALLAGLTHQDFLQRDRCTDALVRIGTRCVPLIEQALGDSGVMVGGEAVPLTANARASALRALESLKGRTAC